ncbi:diaminopimelate decarboxylase [Alphaproteobacteria bacterium LSUCC0684]
MTGFSRINGTLTVDGIPLEDIAARFPTPLYIYSAATIRESYTRFAEAVAGPKSRVHFAVKSNSNLAILRLLGSLGAGADIVSGGEMQRALKAGIAPEAIIFSGVGKSDAEITAALEAGIGQINAESEAEVMRILALAGSSGRSSRLALRINPDVDASTHAKISTGKSDTKFGISREAATDLYRRIAESGVMEPGGLAVHIGSQIMTLEPFREAWTTLLEMARQLEAENLPVPQLDLGGGIGIDYKTGEPADIEAFGHLVRSIFGNEPYHLGFEPGRFLTAEAGILLTETLYTKSTSGKRFIIVDAAMNDLIRPTLYEAYHRIETVADKGAPIGAADIVGPVCETGDYLGLDRMMPAIDKGDLLAVFSAGAYGAVMRSAYNTRPPAAELLVLDGEVHPVSVPQRVEDLLAQDLIPTALQ